MNKQVIFLVLTVFFVVYACNTKDTGTKGHMSDVHASTTSEINSGESEYRNLINSLHWGIDKDSFEKFCSEWIHENATGGNVRISELLVSSDEFNSTYDNNGCLTQYVIRFKKFAVQSDNDLSDEELRRLENVYLRRNQKMEGLLNLLVKVHGEAVNINYDKTDLSVYTTSQLVELAKWEATDSDIMLILDNKTFPDKAGCVQYLSIVVNQKSKLHEPKEK